MLMVKLEEIAHIVGVSKATVSLALNYKQGVGKKKAAEIRDIAATLGYRLPRTRALDTMNTGIISCVKICKHGHVLNKHYDPFLSGYIDGISQGVAKRNYRVEISVYSDTPVREIIQDLIKKQSAGYLILATELNEMDVQEFTEFKAPLVMMDVCYDHIPLDFVNMNNIGAIFKIMHFLSCIGHTHVGYVHSSTATVNLTLRKRGFLRAVKAYDMQYLHDMDYFEVEPTLEGAYRDMKELLKVMTPPPALVCGNDVIAIGTLRALHDMGYTVPQDISVIGFDNLPGAEMCHPPLSSIAGACRQIGQRSSQLLIHRLEGRDSAYEKILIDGFFIQRDSVRSLK